MGSEEKTKKRTWEIVSQWKTQRLRRCRERQSLLRHCVVSNVEESKDSEGKSRKRIWDPVSNGEFTKDADAVELNPEEIEEMVSQSSFPYTSEEEVASAAERRQRVVVHISVRFTHEEEVTFTLNPSRCMLDYLSLEYWTHYEGRHLHITYVRFIGEKLLRIHWKFCRCSRFLPTQPPSI